MNPLLADDSDAILSLISYFSSEINAYQKQIKVISITSEMIWYPAYIFTVAFLDYLWLFHSLNAFHFRTSKPHNFLICEWKHQVWVCIFLVRMWRIFWYQNDLGLLNYFVFAFSAIPFSVGETLYVAYKKYKIKRKFTLFGKYQIQFILWVENRIFPCAAHSRKF